MLVSKCFPSFVVAMAKRPRLSAFMSSETESSVKLQDILLPYSEPKDDIHPPTAPSDSHPRTINPMNMRKYGPAMDEKKKLNYHLHWKSTKHNTIASFTDGEGKRIMTVSGGMCGFKHSRRGEYEAGYQCAVKIFKKIEEKLSVEPFKLELIYKGFGQGRQALDSALLTTEGENIRPILHRLTDQTPLKIGGTRARKARRI
jgi:small subunit ribosomal protein S11